MARYDAQIHFVDQEVGRLLAWLEESGPADSAAVILTSDHGEAFGEYGSFDHFTCYENIAHVPLLVRLPGEPSAGTSVPGFVYGADLTPTILGLAGLECPEGLDGRSLLPALREGAATPHEFVVTDCNALVGQRMIVRDGSALVHTLFAGPFEHISPWELFEVDGDPEEDVLPAQPDLAADLRKVLDGWLTEKLAGLPDPLQSAALGGGWALSHPCLLHGVLANLEQARANAALWEVLRRQHGGIFARLTNLMPGPS
jgi:arylsulfatase A-like enzyme